MATTVMSAVASTASATATRGLLFGRKSNSVSVSLARTPRRRLAICCEVALRSDLDSDSDLELKSNLEKVGCQVRVRAPLKVYHVPKLPQVELTPEMVGVIKQYVGFWKGKHISPNYPFKVQFTIDVPDRGPVKFFAHLREDEFEII